jgi:hypothetical protein
VKEHCEAADCLFPLALGAQGSCQIGGNVATNAGGINVLRYGMMRDLVLGLEAVLPDGEVWNGYSGLRKDNRGYDLKQLFIGSEGTLGIVTGVELKLFPRPGKVETAYLGVASFRDAMRLFAEARRACSDMLTAFEVIGAECIPLARVIDPALVVPVAAPVHILADVSSSGAVDLRALFEAFLAVAMESGLVREAVLAESGAQARSFWAISRWKARSASMLPSSQRSSPLMRSSAALIAARLSLLRRLAASVADCVSRMRRSSNNCCMLELSFNASRSIRIDVRCSGDSTKAPSPCRASMTPSARSCATASRTTLRLTPKLSASCCSVGSRMPGLKSPASMPRLISSATLRGKVSATPIIGERCFMTPPSRGTGSPDS